MALPLKESQAIAEVADVLSTFLPASGSDQWKGQITFRTVAQRIGLGQFWQPGSKRKSLSGLFEQTFASRPGLFEKLIVDIVREGMIYRKGEKAIQRAEILHLNELILRLGFKFPDLWDPTFLGSLPAPDEQVIPNQEPETEKVERQSSGQPIPAQHLDVLRKRFFDLSRWIDRQAAGRAFQDFLYELLEAADLGPKRPFRVTGEEMDGSFELDDEVYLLEAKWEQAALSEAPLLIFREKVQSKSSITRGAFFALNGATDPAMEAITRGKQPNFFIVNGYDIACVLQGVIELPDLLRKKRRWLAERGVVFISAHALVD